MKMCFLTNVEYNDKGIGINYKITQQIKEFMKVGFKTEYIKYSYDLSGIKKIMYHFSFFHKKENNEVLKKVKDADVLYIRYFRVNQNFIQLLKNIKRENPNIYIIVEIPTYPYDYELNKYSISLLNDKLFRLFLKRYINKIITFSNDDEIFGVPTLVISNGVDLIRIKQREIKYSNNHIDIIAIAQIAFWHGFDRIIEGLNIYYKKNGKEKINIHIVGDGPNELIQNLKDRVKKYDLSERVLFYGNKMGAELDDIYEKCNMAFDSLGRHRSKIFYNSTLKGKEYLAKGLPIISGVETELDKEKDYKYYLRVPADDSPVDFFSVCKFYHDIYDSTNEKVISDTIRKFCSDKYDFSSTFKIVIDDCLNNIKCSEPK